MTDVDLAAQTRLSELTERLQEDDPLSIDSALFIEQVKSDVRERIEPKPESLRTEFVVKELRSVSREH